MKKFLPLLFLIFPISLFAEKTDWHLSVEPIFGMRWGQVDEYVFLNGCAYDDDKLSELNWETNSEVYGGLKAAGGWRRIFGEVSFSAGIPMETGLMKDSDWLNCQNSGLEDYQYKTNYSESDNHLDSDVDFGIKLGCAFFPMRSESFAVSLRPFLGFEFRKICFTGKGGTTWYGNYLKDRYAPWDDGENRTVGTISGKAVGYSRMSDVFWLGTDVEFEFEKITLGTGFQISPYAYIESTDIHYQTNNVYLDVTPGFFGAFRWNAGAEWRLNSRSSVKIGADFFYLRVLRGSTYSKGYSAYKKDKTFSTGDEVAGSDGGAGERRLDISVSYRFRIFR